MFTYETLRRSKCKGCGRDIVWGLTEENKKVPLDPRPPVYLVTDQDSSGVHVIRVGRLHMISHFNLCPKASEFSGRNRK